MANYFNCCAGKGANNEGSRLDQPTALVVRGYYWWYSLCGSSPAGSAAILLRQAFEKWCIGLSGKAAAGLKPQA
jgi:hypothetical protein